MLGIMVLVLLVAAVVANVVNGKKGAGGYFKGGRPETWLITLALIAVVLGLAGYAAHQRWDGIFIDRENRVSLARFQLIVWTLLLVSALLTAGLNNAVKPPAPSPLAIRIPPKIWALLGLGAFTAVSAPAIAEGLRIPAANVAVACPPGGPGGTVGSSAADRRVSAELDAFQTSQNLSARPCFDGRVLVKNSPADARWSDLVLGDYQGFRYVDVSKLQQLAFTLLLISVYGMALRVRMAGTDPIQEFPDVDTGFVALLALSHGAYLADKQFALT